MTGFGRDCEKEIRLHKNVQAYKRFLSAGSELLAVGVWLILLFHLRHRKVLTDSEKMKVTALEKTMP